MKKEKIKFTKRMSAFFFVFIIIFISVNISYNYLVIPQKHVYKSEIQFIQNNNENLSILSLGDSHPAWAVNPQYIPNSFNYAVPTETYEQTYYKLRKILNDKNNFDALVFPFDLHSFSDYQKDPYFNIWYWSKFMAVKELAEATNKSLIRIYINKYFPFIGNGNEFKLTLFKSQRSEVISGWHRREEIFANLNATKDALEKVQIQFKNYPAVIDENLFNYFQKILDLSKSKNKTVILIKYPVTKEYKSAVKTREIDIHKFYLYFNEPLSKYDNIYIIDYQDSFTNYSLFSDSNHLNKWGAEIFSKRINDDFKKLNLIKNK